MRYLKQNDMEIRESFAFFDCESNRWIGQVHKFKHGEKFPFKCKDGTIKKYDFISEFHEGFAAIELNGKMGFIDKDGKEICPIKYSLAAIPDIPPTLIYSVFSEGYAKVAKTSEDGRRLVWGYIDTEGIEVSPFIYGNTYEQNGSFHNGFAVSKMFKSNKYVVINKEFIEVSKEYDYICNSSYGYSIVKLGEHFGYIDETGKEICEVKYDYAYRFHKDGLANAGLHERKEYLQFVDKNGKEYHLEEDGILYPYDESNPTKYRYVFPDDRYFIV